MLDRCRPSRIVQTNAFGRRVLSSPSKSAAYAALLTASLVWGGSVVAQKVALGAFSAVEVSVFRGLGALGILVPLWWWQEQAKTRLTMRDLGVLTALGLAVLGNHLLILYGLQHIGAGAAGVIIGASPAITAFLSSLMLRDIPFRRVWVGCAVSFIGVALVSGGNATADGGADPLLGGGLVVLALISWALYTIGSRWMMEGIVAADGQLDDAVDLHRFSGAVTVDRPASVGGGSRKYSSLRLGGVGLRHRVCHRTGPASLALWGIRYRPFTSRDLYQFDSRIRTVVVVCHSRGIVGPDQSAGHRIRPGRGLVGQPLFRDLGGFLDNGCSSIARMG